MTAAASRPAAPGRSGTWQPVQMGACSGRTFLVTGANTGIGLATATGLAERGGRVVLACRDLAKAGAARDAIASATGSEALDLLALDLADLDAVRETVAEIERLDLPVDVLIANAGLAGQRGETAQGFELAFGVTDMKRLTKDEVRAYIRYIADRRLAGLGLKAIFGSGDNPLPWVDAMLGVSHTNFFENRVVDYAKGALTGDWADVWGQAK